MRTTFSGLRHPWRAHMSSKPIARRFDCESEYFQKFANKLVCSDGAKGVQIGEEKPRTETMNFELQFEWQSLSCDTSCLECTIAEKKL